MIELEVGTFSLFQTGRPYTNFLDISVEKSLDALTGTFTFSATATPFQKRDFPIKAGQPCRILIDRDAVINGFIEVINVGHSVNHHVVTIQGRDQTSDVVDSTLGGDFGKNEQVISLVQFTKEVLKQANIKDIDVSTNVGDMKKFGIGEILDAESGETVREYLERYARKRQVLLTTDSNGNISYLQASGIIDTTTQLISLVGDDRNNILSASVTNDISTLFNQYIVRSQSNLGASNLPGIPNVAASTSQQGLAAFDSLIRSSRILNIIAETSSNDSDCQERAAWQRNIKRAQAFQYNCVVQGHLKGDGKPWELNRIVNIKDENCGVDNDLLLNSIEWNFSLEGGSTTSLGFVEKNSYTVSLDEPVVDEATSLGVDIGGFLDFVS